MKTKAPKRIWLDKTGALANNYPVGIAQTWGDDTCIEYVLKGSELRGLKKLMEFIKPRLIEIWVTEDDEWAIKVTTEPIFHADLTECLVLAVEAVLRGEK